MLVIHICWKALDEIYNIYMLLHCSDLNISVEICVTYSNVLLIFLKNCKSLHFRVKLVIFRIDVNGFSGISRNISYFFESQGLCATSAEFSEICQKKKVGRYVLIRPPSRSRVIGRNKFRPGSCRARGRRPCLSRPRRRRRRSTTTSGTSSSRSCRARTYVFSNLKLERIFF